MSAAEPSEATGDELKARSDAARAGGSAKYAEKLRQEHKLPVRRRLELLLDPDFLIEDGLLAHSDEPGYGADGVVTAIGRIDGRTVCVMANDPTVKAGSWGPRTVEKLVRIQETGARMHTTISGCGDMLVASDEEAIAMGRRYLSYFPQNWLETASQQSPAAARPPFPLDSLVPEDEGRAFNMQHLIDGVIDEGSFF